MFSWIFGRRFGLSADERKEAGDAKERTLRLLSDALKKKKSLLVEDPKEFEDQKMKYYYCPFITTDLVKELIRELEKVTFAKNTIPEKDSKAIAYVYPVSEDRTIYLCALFWKHPEYGSQEDTIIHEVSHFLGYGHTVQENSDRVKKSPQSMLCPLTTYSVASAFTPDMDHPGTYTDGSYSCCGETSRDTVCEKSWMANNLSSLRARKNDDDELNVLFADFLFTNWLRKLNDTLNFLIGHLSLVERLDFMKDLLPMIRTYTRDTKVLVPNLTRPEVDKEAKPKEKD